MHRFFCSQRLIGLKNKGFPTIHNHIEDDREDKKVSGQCNIFPIFTDTFPTLRSDRVTEGNLSSKWEEDELDNLPISSTGRSDHPARMTLKRGKNELISPDKSKSLWVANRDALFRGCLTSVLSGKMGKFKDLF